MSAQGDLVYMIGIPGSGKTTLTKELFQSVKGVAMTKPFLHIVRPGGVELGGPRESFGGTDALGMSVQPLVVPFLVNNIWDIAFGEGDRLANERFFMACSYAGWRVHVVLLDTPKALAAERRAARGSHQSETWLRGRETKVANLAHFARLRLDGRKSPTELAAEMRAIPFIRKLIGGANA